MPIGCIYPGERDRDSNKKVIPPRNYFSPTILLVKLLNCSRSGKNWDYIGEEKRKREKTPRCLSSSKLFLQGPSAPSLAASEASTRACVGCCRKSALPCPLYGNAAQCWAMPFLHLNGTSAAQSLLDSEKHSRLHVSGPTKNKGLAISRTRTRTSIFVGLFNPKHLSCIQEHTQTHNYSNNSSKLTPNTSKLLLLHRKNTFAYHCQYCWCQLIPKRKEKPLKKDQESR